MTEAQQSLEALRALARSYCDTIEQSESLSDIELLRRLNDSLPKLYPLGRALPLTDPPPDDEEDEELLAESFDMQSVILASRADALMQDYMAHYRRGQQILESKIGSGTIPNAAPPSSQAARDRVITKAALVSLLAVAYAGLRDLFDLEADKDADARLWYWRTQLTGAWAESQLMPATRILQIYLDALA